MNAPFTAPGTYPAFDDDSFEGLVERLFAKREREVADLRDTKRRCDEWGQRLDAARLTDPEINELGVLIS